MPPATGDLAAAYAYAWWLSGEDDLAIEAVRAALHDAGAGPPDRETLLRRVRDHALQRRNETAARGRTMCPASEVALLHDGQGLDLTTAAELADVHPDDARTELAHGRLEALIDTVEGTVLHPERLGGLAVGNPADVAHARQCPSCEVLREALHRGREELRRLPVVPVPADLLEPSADSPASPPGAQPPAPAPTLRDDLRWLAAVALAAIAVVTVVLLLVASNNGPGGASGGSTAADVPPDGTSAASQSGDQGAARPDPPGSSDLAGDPDAGDGGRTGARPALLPAAQTAPPAGVNGFAVTGVTLHQRGDSGPLPAGATIDPRQPLRIVVGYRDAAAGVGLAASWTVDSEPFRHLAVRLDGPAGTHTFTVPVPPDGWPSGAHQVVLGADGEVVAALDFAVP